MASRRLDISSLLCDDNPPNFSPLDALVQAATEERRRLIVTEPSPRFLPLPGPLSPHYEEDQRIHRQRHQHHDHILLQPLHQHQQDVIDMDRRRSIQDAELQKRIDGQQRAQEFSLQRDRPFQLERRHDPYDRQREDHFRIQEAERQRELEQRAVAYQREVERQRELERQREMTREIERQREMERQREIEKREMDRLLLDRQREIDRQRDIERQRENERQKELERQRELEHIQRRQQFHDSPLRFHDPRIPSPIVTSPHPPSISHLISHPPPRKSDPGQIMLLNSPIHPDPSPHHLVDDTRQVKKRRYSESPTRPILNDKDRMAREREKMVVGELGYGRIDSPIAGPSTVPATVPRRPGSGHGQGRKSMPVSELLLEKPIPVPQADPRDRLVSPLGRRSPPGSQIGRAKAARKSDEHVHKEILLPPPPPSLSVELDVKKYKEEPKPREMPKVKEEIKSKDEVKPKEEPKSREGMKFREAKEDTKPTRHRVSQEDVRPKKVVTPAPISAPLPPPPPPPPAKIQLPSKPPQDDAHEWFLQQYEEDPSPTTSSRPEPPHSPSPSLSPVTSTLPINGPRSPLSPYKTLTPITAAVALEQELELVSEPLPPPTTVNKKQDPDDTDMDLDVDLAVTELVEETLNGEDVRHEHEHVGMEVDVEDELLSLIDDRFHHPLANNGINTARRTSTSSASHATASGTGPGTKQPPLRSAGDAPHASPTISASSSTTLVSPAAQHPSTRPTSERGSMPPPTTTGVSKKSNERAGNVVPVKKKEPAPKGTKVKAATANATTQLSTAPSKPRAKPTTKGKKATVAAAVDVTIAVVPSVPSTSKTTKATIKKSAPSTSRSRSTSVMPGGSAAPEGADAVKPEKQEEEEDSDAANDDDKLYCVCKTKYDEDRFMIACDKCDEWYHTQCVDMPELEVDLVDQFICPPCIQKNPHLNLRTTYKQRCLYGLRHPDPNSSKACHKAARGAFSKYCSETCGVKYMQSRIDSWAKKGGDPGKLWDSVKNAEKREGVVVCAVAAEVNGCANGDGGAKMEVDSNSNVKPLKQHRIMPSTRTKVERETERLTTLLESVMNLREEIKKGMEVVVWREQLLQLASERADNVGLCGWDQRLCFDDEEWADIGAGVLESYEGLKEEAGDGEMDMDVGEWWCPGQKLCDRHAGWQTVRYKDVCKEREKKEEALTKLTTREREIRKRIEDMLDPQNRTSGETTSRGTVKNPNPNIELARQFLKRKFKGSERGKKRKASTC